MIRDAGRMWNAALPRTHFYTGDRARQLEGNDSEHARGMGSALFLSPEVRSVVSLLEPLAA
jgi:hypothetical protein